MLVLALVKTFFETFFFNVGVDTVKSRIVFHLFYSSFKKVKKISWILAKKAISRNARMHAWVAKYQGTTNSKDTNKTLRAFPSPP